MTFAMNSQVMKNQLRTELSVRTWLFFVSKVCAGKGKKVLPEMHLTNPTG